MHLKLRLLGIILAKQASDGGIIIGAVEAVEKAADDCESIVGSVGGRWEL